MNPNTALILTGLQSVTISTPEQARQQRDALLIRARKGSVVNSVESANHATEILKELTAFSRSVESDRQVIKAPVLEIGRKIDDLSRDLIAEIEREVMRIGQLIGAWQAEQNRVAEQKRREAWAQEQTLRRAAEEKQRLADEQVRKELAELQAKADAATGKAKAKLEAEAKALQEKNDQAALAASEKTAQDIVKQRLAVEARIPPKPEGLATRAEIKFEVEDIAKLYAAVPYLVLLSPNNQAIKAALKALPKGGTLPGVRHWIEQKSIVR